MLRSLVAVAALGTATVGLVACGGRTGLEGGKDGSAGESTGDGVSRASGGTGGTAEVAECGDGKRTGREPCDGLDLGGASCQSLGFTAGKLGCGGTCESFDTSGCRKVVGLAAGSYHTCALFEDGSVKCWGGIVFGYGDPEDRGDEPGEMGDALPAVELGTGAVATDLAARDRATCALLADGSVKCWGMNYTGQLGLGDADARGNEPGEMGDALPAVDLGTGRHAHALALGPDHTCALLDDGSIKCWGNNRFGQLGIGDTEDRGDDPGEMGDALPAVDLGTNLQATAMAFGSGHGCAVLDDETLKCWGLNGDAGALGLGDRRNRGDEPGEMGNALPRVDLGTGRAVRSVSAFRFFVCALLDEGLVKCWGENDYGQLGIGDTEDRGDDPGEMGDNLPVVDLGTGLRATSVTLGAYHACALLDGGLVKCWGIGRALGLGDMAHRGDEPGEMGDALPFVDLGTGRHAVALAEGFLHTCALLDNAAVKCWGSNGNGELGLGDDSYRGASPGEMGDALPELEL